MIPKRCRWRPSTPTACPTCAWCSASSSTPKASFSTRMSRAPRVASSSRLPARGRAFPLEVAAPAGPLPRRGDATRRGRGRRLFPFAARAAARSAPGRASSPGRWSRARGSRRSPRTIERKFGDGEIPRPDYWRGFRLAPVEIEFWQDGAFRLHDRVPFHVGLAKAGVGSGSSLEARPCRSGGFMIWLRRKFAETAVESMSAEVPANSPRTMLLTGASRGIGHATVKRFSSAGWRVITCSRHAFPENCPWMAGPQDHLQINLADPEDTARAIAEVRERLGWRRLDALVNNAAISPKGAGGSRLGLFDTELRRLADRLPGQFLRARAARQGARRGTRRAPKARSSTSPRSPARACIRSPASPMRPRRPRSPR